VKTEHVQVEMSMVDHLFCQMDLMKSINVHLKKNKNLIIKFYYLLFYLPYCVTATKFKVKESDLLNADR
jgi:hypothetical protein